MEYKFNFDEKEYCLNEKNLEEFFNDEEKELSGVDVAKIIAILNDSEKVDFGKAYYGDCCENCLAGKEEKNKFFDYVEFSFYLYSKDSNFVISNIQKDYEGLTFKKLLKQRKIDDSYIVTITVCKNCGVYTVTIEQFEI